MAIEGQLGSRPALPRRDFLKLGAGFALYGGLDLGPEAGRSVIGASVGGAPDAVDYDLSIGLKGVTIDQRRAEGRAINDLIPGPLLRLREGQEATIRVTNNLDEDTSLHWHGLLVPPDQDGVPGISFDGIKPGETFTYRFRVRQAGTYWYHSHSGGQEQQGMYAPLVIDPMSPDPIAFDREHVIMLSDWTDEDPADVLRNLKGDGAYYNYGKRTFPELLGGLLTKPGETFAERAAWGRMRMDPTDIADVTGATYSYLLNGRDAKTNWTGVFRPGERVRLRFINAAAMTFFDVKIPGLRMTVVQADGQDVEPVVVDEFRVAVAETYDVIVEPEAGNAYTIFAQTMDRSGFARGTLAESESSEAPIPMLDQRPVRSMIDMPGMEGHDMGGVTSDEMPESMAASPDATPAMDHAAMGHGPASTGPKKLAYADLQALKPNPDVRDPEREVVLRLTGDMERYFWTLNDKKSSQAEPIQLQVGERVRLLMINETMMEHPMHLHGVFMELQNGQMRSRAPRKHTISVPPNGTIEAHLTFDEAGPWAFHCHLLYHMMTGMFVRVEVSERAAQEDV